MSESESTEFESARVASVPLSERAPILRVRDLRTYLFTRWGTTRAVDGVSLDLRPGETLGIVGESGSGKSMLALSLVRLIPEPTARTVSGSVELDGRDLLSLSEKQMRAVRGREIAMVLQDPHQSLNPVYTVGDQMREALRTHGDRSSRTVLDDRLANGLADVGVPDSRKRLSAYPHELSGGMKQRVVGAMALSYEPRVLIADEPTTALDVTIQAQYLHLLRDIQDRSGVGMIIITHDFGVVAQACDTVAVMYAGRIIERGPVHEIFTSPQHVYTRSLLASRPRVDAKVDRLPTIGGRPPSLLDPPSGCRFADRCPMVMDVCRQDYPDSREVGADHFSSCYRAGQL